MATKKLEDELARLYPALDIKLVHPDGKIESIRILNEPLPAREQHEGAGALFAILAAVVLWAAVVLVFCLSNV